MPIPEEELPLTLPETDDFKPSGTPESPLANMTEWINYTDARTGELCPSANPMTEERPSFCLVDGCWIVQQHAAHLRRHAMTHLLDGFIGLNTLVRDSNAQGCQSPHCLPFVGKAGGLYQFMLCAGQKMRRETSTMPQWAGSCW